MSPKRNTTDWSASYSQYLARSAAVSARSMSLYQLVLERIAHGKLPPTIFQDHLPAFVAAHAGEFSKKLTGIGSRFLSELVRLGAALAGQPLAPGSAVPEPPIVPPQFDVSNPARWYEQLAEYAGQINARAVRMYRAQLDRVAAGDATPSEAQQQAAEKLARELPDNAQAMTQLYFDLLDELNDLRSSYDEAYFGGLLSAAKAEPGEQPVTVTLSGAAGSTAAASLSITNETGDRARIGRRVAEVRRVDGAGPCFVPALSFAPEDLDLGPGEEGTLTISLRLDPEQYDSGALYAGRLLLTGAADVPLAVELRILATAPEAPRTGGQQAS